MYRKIVIYPIYTIFLFFLSLDPLRTFDAFLKKIDNLKSN